jgi:hypothetical protein
MLDGPTAPSNICPLQAYELSVLTGTQVLLLVVSETGLVYTFTTPKLQPLVTKAEGKNLIQVRTYMVSNPRHLSNSNWQTNKKFPGMPQRARASDDQRERNRWRLDGRLPRGS